MLITIASGADRPAARELALKIEEAAWIPTTMRDLETFLHGHLHQRSPRDLMMKLQQHVRRNTHLHRYRPNQRFHRHRRHHQL
jgi:fructoselysine-6-P-deglycase FrlB-like protein